MTSSTADLSSRRGLTGRVAVALVAAVFVLGACGGGGDDSADGASGDGGNGGGGAAAALSDSDCREFIDTFLQSDFDSIEPGEFDNMSQFAEQFSNAAERAPSEIRADVQAVAEVLTEYAAVLDEVGFDFSDPSSAVNLTEEDINRLEEATTGFDDEELEAAGARIEAFLEENCGG